MEPASSGVELARQVLVHGPLARVELARRLGLSPASLTRLATPLLRAGLLTELDAADKTPGRPVRPLDIIPTAGRFIGVKLTGHIAHAVATDLRLGILDQRQRHLGDRRPEEVADLIADLVAALGPHPADPLLNGIGVCLGAKVLDARHVVQAPYLGWRDVPLAGLLTERTGLPAVIGNDVVALAQAHHWFGPTRGLTDFAVITMGVGVGYGLVTRDQVVDIPDAGLGLGAHVILDETGGPCPDGLDHRGCAMAMISSPGLEAAAAAVTGRSITSEAVLSAAATGDPELADVVDRAAAGLGRFISLAANLTLTSTIVLGGEGIGLWDVAGDRVQTAAHAGRHRDAEPLHIEVDASGVVSWAQGAAALAIQRAVATLG